MPSDREIFNLSGPTHLTAVDWTNAHHRRSVAASLVQGVYILERDRQQNRHGPQALAPPWWNVFHFQLNQVLTDEVDISLFGAVYEFQNRHGPQALAPPWWNVFHFQLNQVLTDEVDISLFGAVYEFQYPTDPALNIPKYVIAFRGTILKPDTRSQDFKLDLQCIRNKLHQSPRFQVAMQTVQNIVALAGAPNVWLTGHSLGSAIALLAGKNMSKMGYFLESYLFNPPFLSVDPLERIKDERVKHGIRFAKSVLKAGLTHALQGSQHQKSREHDPFAMLSHWIPYLFVNPADHICSGYIGYYEHRKKMGEMGAGKIERLATKNSMRSLVSCALGGDSEALHLLPSAYLTMNLGPSPDFKRAHGIHQWWNPHFPSQSTLHHYDHLY